MSDILLNWINNEVKLSKNIQNIAEDFSNGYFFGELLYKYKLLPQFNQFRNSNEKSSITKNYTLLQYKFDELNINFTDKDKKDILNKKKYKAEMFLFKIREKLLSKLLQIDQITERINNTKKLNKLYKHVSNNTNPHQRIKSAKREIKNNLGDIKEVSGENENQDEKNKNNSLKKKRLASARLPKLSKNALNIGKNKQCVSGIESIVSNNILNKEENQLLKDTVKEIEIYENIHMNNKKKIEILEKKKHENEELKEKNHIDLWKKSYNKIKKYEEEKKEKDLQKINRLKSATQKSFNKANQNYLNHINKFDKNLDHLGLNSDKELNIENQKKNEISTENYMKSIIEAVKEKELLKKQYEIRIRRITGPNPLDNIIEDKKDYEKNDLLSQAQDNKQRPKSSATTVMFYSKNKNIDKNNINILDKNKSRPFTAKSNLNNLYKNQIDLKKNLSNKNKANSKDKNITRPKSGINNNLNNNFDLSIGGSQLSKIAENSSLLNSNRKEFNIPFDEYINNDTYDENKFFEKVYRESGNYFRMKAKERHKEITYNRKNIEKIVNSLLDITDLCYNYKNIHNTKLVDIEEWNKIINNFINNIPLIHKKEKKPKPKIEEDLDNSTFGLYNPIKDKEIKDFGQYEYDELKNFIYFLGEKYDPLKNSLFVKKCKLGNDKLDINDVMGEEDIKIMIEEAKKMGKQITIEEDDKEDFSDNNKNKIRYKPNKEEQEILEPYKEKYPYNLIFTNLIYESIKFSYDKDPKTFIPKDNKVIEEEINLPPPEIIETEGSIKKNIISENDKNEKSKISDENKNEHNTIIEEEKININIKELIESIPIRVSFLGVQKTEKKTRAKNLEKKYPGLKIYNISDFKKNLEENNKIINDENIIDLLINKIKEDFNIKKNKDEIKKEIIKKREYFMNLNNEMEKLREEQEKKIKFNIAKDIQNIQQQIDKINIESIIGFILIGIPENIVQLKIMEKKFMEFTQPCEREKGTYEIINEKLLHICDQPQKESKEEENINLTLNKIVHFESNKDVIFQKIDNRKKDPVKGDIYQMNLFPPKDKKILARLEDILTPTHEEIENDIINDINNYELIEEFYKNFNIKCSNFIGYIKNENINEITNYKNYLQLLEQNQIELDNKISKEIEEALLIYEDKMVGTGNENTPFNEVSEIIENNNENSLLGKEKEKKESELSGDPNMIINNSNKIVQSQSNKKEIIRDSISSMTLINDISRINSNNYINTTQGEISSSQFNFFTPSSLSEIELFNTFHLWKKFIYFYTNQHYKIFNKDRKLGRGKFIEKLNSIQKEFIQFLSRPSDKNIIINQFLNKYKEFSNKCRFIQNMSIARARYLSDIDELNETLWKIVEIRKFEALDKIDNLTNIIDHELKVSYHKIEQMVILETQKFLEIINILLRFISKSKIIQINTTTNTNQFYSFIINNPTEAILRKTDECELAEYNENTKKYNYPRANRLYKNCLRILIKLHNYLSKNIFKPHEKLISHSPNTRNIKRQKTKRKNQKILSKQSSLSNKSQFNPIINTKTNEVQNQLKLAIKAEIEKYKYIAYNYYIISLEALSKIFCASKLVFKLMDDWVIDSLQYQNNAMNIIFNKLKNYSIDDIIKNKNILSEENIYKNIELDDFSKKYILFNYDDFLSDGKSDENQNLSIEELNNRELSKNIIKIFKLFTNFGININNIFGEIIMYIKTYEIQKGIIKKSTFEKIFFVNKIISNTNRTLFPQYFYNFDFHNITKFLSHFIKLSTDFISQNVINNDKPEEDNNENKEINEEINEEEHKDKNNINNKSEVKNEINEENQNEDNKAQELIYTNQILTILFLICFEVISNKEIEKIKIQNENKLINGKFMNKNDFISIKFSFEDIINKKCRTEQGMAEQFKIFLFDLNANNNGLINFNDFIDLISLKSLKFEDDIKKDEIKYYFNLFYN